MDTGVVVAAVLGVAVAAALWWLYFDIVALVAERRLSNAAEGRERNEMARDSFSYLHLPMVAGIVLLALGLKKTLEHVDDPLKLVPAVAMLGGIALYLLAHVAFRWRNVHRFSVQRRALRGGARGVHPGGGGAAGARDARLHERGARGADRLRVDPLRRTARSPAAPAGRRLTAVGWRTSGRTRPSRVLRLSRGPAG